MKQHLTRIILLLTIALALSSCGDSDYIADDPIVGRWALQTVNSLPPSQEIDYEFYSDYTGAIVYNAGLPAQYTVPFEWDTQIAPGGAAYVTLYNYNGTQFRYLYSIRYQTQPGYGTVWFLQLTDLDTGDQLLFQEY